MSRQRLVVIAAIVGAGFWLLWPESMDDSAATATAGPYRVQLTGESPKVGISPVTVEITGNGGQPPAPDSVAFEPAMPQMGHATTPVVAVTQATAGTVPTSIYPWPGNGTSRSASPPAANCTKQF